MTRRSLALAAALLAGLATPALAAPDREAHHHRNLVFQLRVEPEMGTYIVYRAFLAVPDDPASLMVERSRSYLADEGQVDLYPSACPALMPAVAAIAALPPPAVQLDGRGRYEPNAPRATQYDFAGFVRFPNGGEGELSFTTWEVAGRPSDPQLTGLRNLVRAFDSCRRRD